MKSLRITFNLFENYIIMTIKSLIAFFAATFILASCSAPKDVTYMQDMTDGYVGEIITVNDIRVRPGDQISIMVNSRDPLLASMFNLVEASNRAGGSGSSTGNSRVSSYTVSPEGDIDFPVLGKVHVAGMNRNEVTEYIKNRLISEDLVKEPIVTMEYVNTGINIMGEVNAPGRYGINKDKITILEALSLAGDLTITGKRDNILVTREIDGKPHAFRVDLTNSHALYSSPVYYLQPDDVVYVEPVNMKKRQRTVNGNSVLTPSFWLTVASFVTSVAVLIFK